MWIHMGNQAMSPAAKKMFVTRVLDAKRVPTSAKLGWSKLCFKKPDAETGSQGKQNTTHGSVHPNVNPGLINHGLLTREVLLQ